MYIGMVVLFYTKTLEDLGYVQMAIAMIRPAAMSVWTALVLTQCSRITRARHHDTMRIMSTFQSSCEDLNKLSYVSWPGSTQLCAASRGVLPEGGNVTYYQGLSVLLMSCPPQFVCAVISYVHLCI